MSTCHRAAPHLQGLSPDLSRGEGPTESEGPTEGEDHIQGEDLTGVRAQ